MRLHFHIIKTISIALDDIFSENRYADKVIERVFKANKKLGSRDRRFIAETIYEIVRNYRYYSEIALTNESYAMIAVHLLKTNQDVGVVTEEVPLDIPLFRKRLKDSYSECVEQSFPDWINELGIQEFGQQDWSQLMKALNKPADVYLRTNTLKTTPELLKKELAKEEIFAEQVDTSSEQQAQGLILDSCLKLQERKNVFTTQAFKNGMFEVQDAASQFIAPMLDVQPGQRVVDACAGAGGKSLHLAALMKNKGKIISMDIHEWKLGELKKRAARNRVDIIETKLIDSTKVIKRLEKSFDRVLLDVPCSGLGVIRRNPDTKWKLSLEEINRLVTLQREIITDYSQMCKVNGNMIYATCSILNKENEEQVQWFLNSEAGKHWELVKELRLWPHKDHFDGFYAALLKRKS